MLIDIKTDGEKTYAALGTVLAKYSSILTTTGPKTTSPPTIWGSFRGFCSAAGYRFGCRNEPLPGVFDGAGGPSGCPSISRTSTSKMRVAFGPIFGPLPRVP